MDETIWKCLTCGEKFLEFEAVGKHRKSQHYGNQYKNKRRRAKYNNFPVKYNTFPVKYNKKRCKIQQKTILYNNTFSLKKPVQFINVLKH